MQKIVVIAILIIAFFCKAFVINEQYIPETKLSENGTVIDHRGIDSGLKPKEYKDFVKKYEKYLMENGIERGWDTYNAIRYNLKLDKIKDFKALRIYDASAIIIGEIKIINYREGYYEINPIEVFNINAVSQNFDNLRLYEPPN